MLLGQLPPDTLVRAKGNILLHAAVWALTVVGLLMLWSAAGRADVPHSGRPLVGGALRGWGYTTCTSTRLTICQQTWLFWP